MNDLGGPTFGRYVVSERVGEGSLGVVYRARHAELGRDAAVKVLRAEVRGSVAAVAGMVAEAATLARLDHPNIVALYDFVQEPERTWLAEQWVEGAPLDAILARHRRLTPEQALGVMAGALAGLAYAHDSGVVHRDVAASNVLADMAGTSMLVDFGLASPVSGESGSGAAGVVGTPAYLSPEAARGEPVGKPGDVYSAAALTFHLLSGVPVFTGTAWEMVAAHRDRIAPRLEGHGPRLAGLVERSLAKDPSGRPPDAAAFLAELEEGAEEKYGVGWRSRASIAGLVASTLGVGAGTVAAGGAAAPTVVAEGLPQAVTGATQASVSTGRRVGIKTILAAGATAAVVIAGVVVGITLASDDGDGDDADASSSQPTINEEELREQERERRERERQEKIEKLERGAISGKYRVVQKITRASYINGGSSVPPNESYTWTFSAPRCTPSGCSGTVRSTAGAADISFSWDGRTLTIERAPTVEKRGRCVDESGTVKPFAESGWRGTFTYDYQPANAPAGADGLPPKRFTVRRTATFSDYSLVGDCEWTDDTWTELAGVLEFTRSGR